LKVSTNVKIAMQCFENFGGTNAPNAPPGCSPATILLCHYLGVQMKQLCSLKMS